MNKYDFDKQLKRLPSAVFYKWAVPIANAFIPLLPKGLDRHTVTYVHGKAGNIWFHTLRPKRTTNSSLPCLFYLHGGGFAYKQTFVHYKLEQVYCTDAPCVVFSVDYPVLPKATYPTAIDAAVHCYKYMADNAERLGIDVTRIVIGGDSAGGNLALETTIAVGTTNLPQPIGLMTLYPVVDDRQNTPSMHAFVDTPLWNARCNAKMWQWYLDGKTYVSPLERLGTLSVRHVFVETEQYDCLHDEGVALYNVLAKSIPDVQLLDNSGTYHGFDINLQADVTQRSLRTRTEFLQRCFEVSK